MTDPLGRRYTEDVPLDAWSHVRVWLACGGGLLFLHGMSADPTWVEQTYVRGFGATIASWLTWLTAPVPIAVAEVLVVLLVAWEVLRFLEGLANVGAERRRISNAVLGFLLHVADLAIFVGLWFYVAWGLSYARIPATERLALTPPEADVAALRAEVATLRRKVDAAYLALHGTDDAGTVTAPRPGLDVDAVLDDGFAASAARWDFGEAYAAPRGPTKAPFGTIVLSYLGVAGIYVPFTGEAVVNDGPPAWSVAASRAHEKAHQRMVASEDEATFHGFLAMMHTDEPFLHYVAWQTARRQVQGALARVDPDIEGFLATHPLLPGVQKDLVAVHSYWAPYEGWLQEAHTSMNDAYLRAHAVEGGVQSYRMAVDLVRAWLATEDGREALAKP